MKNDNDPIRVVQSVQIKKKYSIIEMAREATPKEIDKYNLRYCGRGYWKDEYIQQRICDEKTWQSHKNDGEVF